MNPERILLFAMKKKPRQTAHNLGAEGAPSEKVTRELTRTEWRVIQRLRRPLPPLDPENVNGAMLDFMLACEAELHLSPQRLQDLTGIRMQHHRKMHPQDPKASKPHVTVFTLIRWITGVKFHPLMAAVAFFGWLEKK